MSHPEGGRQSSSWRAPFRCDGCGRPYPSEGFPHRCPECGSTFDISEGLCYDPIPDEPRSTFRHRKTYPLPEGAKLISLGEGDTPLLPLEIEGREVWVKCEHLNPTGSFKDRGTFLLASILVHAGISEVVEDSSGNAGASLAAYAAKAGIRAQIFVPAYSSGPKRLQIEAYGAEVVSVPGPRTATTEAVLRVVEEGANYASHAYQPHGMAGMMTVAFEIVEQLGRSPGSVILPVGQGSLFLGLARGFWAMVEAGEIENMPQMIAVQARACAPLWAVHQFGAAGRLWMREGETAAEGIRILHPLRGDRVLDAIERSGGTIVAVQEEEIEDGWGALSRRGFFVEPTSAVVWPALLSTGEELSDPIVMVLTGSGFKSVDGLRREART